MNIMNIMNAVVQFEDLNKQRVRGLGDAVRLPAGTGIFLYSTAVSRPTLGPLLPNDTRDSFHWVKWPERAAGHSPHNCAQVKNASCHRVPHFLMRIRRVVLN